MKERDRPRARECMSRIFGAGRGKHEKGMFLMRLGGSAIRGGKSRTQAAVFRRRRGEISISRGLDSRFQGKKRGCNALGSP